MNGIYVVACKDTQAAEHQRQYFLGRNYTTVIVKGPAAQITFETPSDGAVGVSNAKWVVVAST